MCRPAQASATSSWYWPICRMTRCARWGEVDPVEHVLRHVRQPAHFHGHGHGTTTTPGSGIMNSMKKSGTTWPWRQRCRAAGRWRRAPRAKREPISKSGMSCERPRMVSGSPNQHGQPAAELATLAGGKHLGPLTVEQPDRDGEHDGAVGLLVSAPDAAEQVHKARHIHEGQPASTMSQGRELAAGVGAGVAVVFALVVGTGFGGR